MFTTCPMELDNDRDEWITPTQHLGLQKDVIFDTHFLGFTALNDVNPSLHALDCIAISGLASHPFGSWKQRDEPDHQLNFMWLRDQLPKELPRLRSVIYGYDTRLVMNESFQTIDDLALSFIQRLTSIGQSLLSARPLVFLAHSLGGIVLKRALVEMANSSVRENFMLDYVLQVFSFGVPNRGMKISHFLPMVSGQPNARLIRALSEGSTYLSKLDEQFSGVARLRDIRLISIYETKRSRTVERDISGQYKRTGSFEMLVNRESAIQAGSDIIDVFPIDKDHSDMVKFAQDGADYRVIAGKLWDLIESITDTVLTSTEENSTSDDVTSLSNPWKLQNILPDLFDFEQTKDDCDLLSTHSNLNLSASTNDARALHNADLDPSAIPTTYSKFDAQELVKSLYVGETFDRLNSIKPAYEATFDWIWANENLSFTKWLHDDRKAYWISGKPGSGKSTAMKYIYEKLKAKQVVDKRNDRPVYVAFFFHNRGSHMQKSFEGLLCSILHQVLVLKPRLTDESLPLYMKFKRYRGNFWDFDRLTTLFARLFEQNKVSLKLYLFLDALDEYDGPPTRISDFIQMILDMPNDLKTKVKVCFSSRLSNTFIDRFKSLPGFKIDEQTRPDTQKYVTGRLHNNPSTDMLLNSNDAKVRDEVAKLELNIIEEAEGVFLWLKIVMDESIQAHAEGSTIAEVTKNLASFPKDLEELYVNIIQRIPAQLRMESFVMLEIVLRAGGALRMETFRVATACAPCQTLQECIEKNSLLDLVQYTLGNITSTERRIKSRCGGLLELITGHWHSSAFIQFMHQTVKDFIMAPGFEKLFTESGYSIPEENGFSFLYKARLALVLSQLRVSKSKSSLHSLVRDVHKDRLYGHQAEMTTGRSQRQIFDELCAELFQYSISPLSCLSMPFDSPLSLAVVSNLRLYVKETLEDGNSVNANLTAPLLRGAAYAVGNPSPYPLGGPLHEELLPTQAVDDLSEMVKLLFSYSGDKDAHYRGLTAFQLLFKGLLQYSEAPGGPDRKASMVNTARVFLENKQDPNVDIIESMAIREEATWCKALHIAWKDMTCLLLEFKADVNALDSSGLTPLDVCLGAGSSQCRLGEQRESIEALDIATLLLDSGGCATRAGLKAAGHFTRRFSGKLKYELDYRLRNPPLLENKVSLGSHLETFRQEPIQMRSNQPKPRRMRNQFVDFLLRSRAGTKE